MRNSIVGKDGLRETCKRQARADADEASAPEDPLSRLKELRDMLRASLKAAAPKEMAGLAREYRATVEAIERMEGDPDDEAAAAIDSIAKSIAARMPS